MIKRILFIFSILLALQSRAQFYVTGVEPFGTKWKQIRTDNFRILFPAEAERIALRYANLLSVTDSITPKSLKSKQKSFDIVIHNHSTLSNGFVVWAPKRMEIIAQPPTSTSAQPWLTQLALHETRHTSQIFKLNSGIVKPASFLFGEQIVGASAGFVPSWFLEGDAVAFETATSNSGRGREADFYQYYRAHYLSRANRFKYDKWLLGSYQDNIPNHYNFGYQLVCYANLECGRDVWANTLQYVSRHPYTLIPFYFGLKRQTSLSRNQLFKKTFNHLDSLWSTNQKGQTIINYQPLTKIKKEYTDYRYPYQLNESTIIAYKKSLSVTPRFVAIDLKTQKEKTLVQSGYLTSTPSFYDGNILWTEYTPHIRWEYKNYSIVKWYNKTSGETKIISDRGRYFSPIYNPNDNLVYVISGKDDGSNSIVAFNLKGERRKEINLPNDYQPFELTLNNEKKQILLGVVGDRGKSIVGANEDGTYNLIYGPTYLNIHSISSHADFILFSTTVDYKEDIFALNVTTKEVFQITKTAFGATDPAYSLPSKKIIFSNYTIDGYCISMTNQDSLDSGITLSCTSDDMITKKLRTTENFNIDSIDIPDNIYKTERYGGIKTLAKIHSWTPFYYNVNQLTTGDVNIKPGVTIYSQNLTGTSVLTAGYGYDQTHLTRINYQYYGFFPVLSYEFELSGIAPTVHYIKKTETPRTLKQRKESTFSIYLPLRFSSSGISTQVYPFFQIISANDYFFSKNDSLYHRGFQRFNYRVYFSSLHNQALKNVRPRLGFSADLSYENAPLNRNNFGSLASGLFFIYLPGLGCNHSLLIKPSFQKQNLERHFFSNKIIFPRGYYDFPSETFKSISADYLMPIAYPDFAVGSIAYLKRISINSFFDYAKNSYPISKVQKHTDVMKSFGFEVFADLNMFRTKYPIRLKFQQGWAGNNHVAFNSFTLAVDFYGQ